MKRMKKKSSAVQRKHAPKQKQPETAPPQSLTNDDTYRNLFLNAALGIFHSTFDGRFIDVNPALAKMMGYGSPEEVVRSITSIAEQVYAEPPKWGAVAKAAMEAGGVFSVENRYRRKNGEVWHGKLHLRIVSDEQGTPRHYEGFIEDITDRTIAENGLRESEERFRTFIEQSVDGLLLVDERGTVCKWNRAMEQITGISHAQAVGRPWLEFMAMMTVPERRTPERIASFTATIESMLKNGTMPSPNNIIDAEIITPHGRRIHIQQSIFVISTPKGYRIGSINRDVTERHRIEETLRESERRHKVFLDLAVDAILIGNPSGIIIEANESAAVLTGYQQSELIGVSINILFTEEERRRVPLMYEDLKQGKTVRNERMLRRKDGSSVAIEMRTKMMPDATYQTFIRDVSDRKRAEDALRESEARFRGIFEESPIGIVITAATFKLERANPAFCRMLGYTERELQSMSFADITHPDHIERDIEGTIKVGRGEIHMYPTEKRYIKKNGDVIWASTLVSALHDSPDGRRHFLATITDITERRAAESNLRIKDWAVASTLDGIALSDLNGMLSYVNPAFLRMWGYDSPAEVLGRPVADFWQTGKQAADVMDALRVHGGWIGEMTGKGKAGNKFFVQISASMIKDADGRPIQMMASFLDITERKIAETALRDSEEKFKTAFHTSPDSININRLDDGRYISINSGFTRIMGYTEDDIIGKTSLEMNIWANPNDRAKLVAGLKQHGKVENLEATFIAKNGEQRFGLMSATVMSINGIPHILSITRDMTERQKLVESLKRAEKLESLGVLAGGIAHDFNNLMAGMFGFIEAARRNLPQGISSEHLDRVLELYGRAKGLSQQLLTFSKGGAPQKKTGALDPLIRKSTLFALSGSVVQAEFTIAGDLAQAEFDESQIAQVIGNIVINAVQAMPTGGRLYVSAENAAVRENEHPPLPIGQFVHISIRDTGIGMPHDILQRIFDPFFTTKQTGSGLGLAICFSIIQKHGGVIEVDSIPGSGSTFHLYLPASSVRCGTPQSADVPVLSGNERILVMDDEDYLRECLSEGLAAFGYEVHTACDGAEAAAKVSAAQDEGKPFHAVFLDLTVRGGMGGRESLGKIRERFTALPVFLMSGYSDDQSTADSERGFNGSLQKPFSINDLILLMRKHVPRSLS